MPLHQMTGCLIDGLPFCTIAETDVTVVYAHLHVRKGNGATRGCHGKDYSEIITIL